MTMKQIVRNALLLMGLVLGSTAQAGKVTYVYTDPQGTPLAEADASGNITATFDYTPYGVSVQGLSGSPNGPGYTGHVNDPDTGLVYMQARYYDPVVGRFINLDPIGSGAGGGYTYVIGNPIKYTDPDGRQEQGAGDICETAECHRQREQERHRKENEPYTGGGLGDVLSIAIDGAGSDNGSDNQKFHWVANKLSAKIYNGKAGFGRGDVKGILKLIAAFKLAHPGGKVYIMGYSAGGDDAIWLAEHLRASGINVNGLVTFDPHVKWRSGYKDYSIGGNVLSAYNYFQRNPHDLLYNTFRGSPVAGAINRDFTGVDPDAQHSTIVTEAWGQYEDEISGAMGH